MGTPQGRLRCRMRPNGVSDKQIENAASLLRPTALGVLALCASFGGLLTWSALAPIASAAIAPGTVMVDGSRKTIQHPDGGVVSVIKVKEGDLVEQGQVLVALDEKRLRSTIQTLQPLLAMKLIRRARLIAERNLLHDLEVPLEITSGIDLSLFPDISADQRLLLAARRDALEARIATTVGEAKQALEASKGLRQQITAQTRRISLTQSELDVAQSLAKSGAGTARRVLEISRVLADIESDVAGLAARAAEADRKVESAALEGRRMRATFLETVENEIGENAREILETTERLSSAVEQFERLSIVAPATGHVVNLAVHTIGAVISPGALLLEIVPSNNRLVIEAQVRPSDIGRVQPGLPVEIHVAGIDGGNMPRLLGVVRVVSADRIVDRSKINPFFNVQIQIDEQVHSVLQHHRLKAGMSVNVMILQGDRTVIEYLAEPILSFFHEALRES